MPGTTPDRATDAALEEHRLARLRALLVELVEHNAFYGPRLVEAGLDGSLGSVAEFTSRAPFTTKVELAADQRAHPPYGSRLSYPLERYARAHQTSSTTGEPLRWLDTPGDWAWLVEAWDAVLAGAAVTAADRLLFAFSFGPFIGFWLGFEAAARRGCLCLPGGALDSAGRLRAIQAHGVTVLCCTPTYALRLGEVGRAEGPDPATLGVRALIVAGEPGGSVPATRARLAELWGGAQVFDHYGMTEVGPVTYQCAADPESVHVIDTHQLVEVVDPATGAPLEPGIERLGELVVTPLGRAGSPVLRYRTGDLVRPLPHGACACGRTTLRLERGIVSRSDHMAVVRGVNVYPSAVDEVVRGVAEVAEYRVRVDGRASLTQIALEVEPAAGCADPTAVVRAVERGLRSAFELRIPVVAVPAGSLPRFELKANRWITA